MFHVAFDPCLKRFLSVEISSPVKPGLDTPYTIAGCNQASRVNNILMVVPPGKD
jgi:hypothetical protein